MAGTFRAWRARSSAGNFTLTPSNQTCPVAATNSAYNSSLHIFCAYGAHGGHQSLERVYRWPCMMVFVQRHV